MEGVVPENPIDPDPRRERCVTWFNSSSGPSVDVLPPFWVLPPQVGKALFKEELSSFDLELLFRFFVIMEVPSLWVWKLISTVDCIRYSSSGPYSYRRRVVPLEWYFEFDKIKQQD